MLTYRACSTDKNIAVWKGNTTPPTDKHLWVTEDNKLYIKTNQGWSLLGAPYLDKLLDQKVTVETDKELIPTKELDKLEQLSIPDKALSSTSTNTVQNKVVKKEIDSIKNTLNAFLTKNVNNLAWTTIS